MLLETAAAGIAVGAGETAIAETAVESAVASAEINSNAKALQKILESAVIRPEQAATQVMQDAFQPGNSLVHKMLERTLSASTKGELAFEMLEELEVAEEVELAEASDPEQWGVDLLETMENKTVGQTLVPQLRGSYMGQISRLAERAAILLKDAAVQYSEAAAISTNAANAERIQTVAELLEDISAISDLAGDYLGIVSYPEFMVRHSSGSK